MALLQIPLERLLLETDAPDGKPRLGDPYQEKLVYLQAQNNATEQDLNHPVNIRCVFGMIAVSNAAFLCQVPPSQTQTVTNSAVADAMQTDIQLVIGVSDDAA